MSELFVTSVDPDINHIREDLHRRLEVGKAPFHVVDQDAARTAIDRLRSAEPEHWVGVWAAAAEPFEDEAARAEERGDYPAAMNAYLAAYGLMHAARFPSPTHPAKWAAYLRSIHNYRAAGRFFDPPLEVIEVPFAGNPGEAGQVTFYVRRPTTTSKLPVVIRWGGVDTWKEERNDYNDAMLAAGFASINADMPGVGQAPIVGSLDAERQFVPILDWIEKQANLDATRVLVVGMSYGGYWATKVAHCFPDRILAAVNWGGGIDRFFSRDWCLKSAGAKSYLMDLGGARARTVGLTTYADYIDRVAGFSLVDQGVLDRPHCPMLVVNGRHDEQVPFDDMITLLEHGQPKEARFFPGGHMGYGPDTFPTVLNWLRAKAGLNDSGPVC
jgi:esterase FrsA